MNQMQRAFRARSHRSVPPLKTIGLVVVILLLAVVTLCLVQFRGGFNSYNSYTVVSDRSGLVMDQGAKVELHGVQIGRVSKVTLTEGSSSLQIQIEPRWSHLIPSNATAEIKAATTFGSKYVALNIPPGPSEKSMAPGSTITSLNVTTEVNTLFESVTSVMQSIDPAKLNAVLGAFADGLNGRGKKLGETLVSANSYLRDINPHMSQLEKDFNSGADVFDIYARAMPDIMSTLDNGSTTADTITAEQKNLNALLLAAIGFGDTGTDLGNQNSDAFVSANHLLVPTTALLEKYSPQYPCMLRAAVSANDVMNKATSKTGYSLSVDAALLPGDNLYRYPDNLPKVAAKGGPGGKPGCYAPISTEMYPEPYLVTNTGVNLAGADSYKPNTLPLLQWLVSGTSTGGDR